MTDFNKLRDLKASRDAAEFQLKLVEGDALATNAEVDRAKRRFREANALYLEAATDAIAPSYANGATPTAQEAGERPLTPDEEAALARAPKMPQPIKD